jgi:hypothetical protein
MYARLNTPPRPPAPSGPRWSALDLNLQRVLVFPVAAVAGERPFSEPHGRKRRRNNLKIKQKRNTGQQNNLNSPKQL